MNIVFMGTPDFAKESLEAVYNAGYNVQAVVTNTDKPKGRGMKLICSPVKEFAIEKNIPIMQPEKIRNNEEFINSIKELNPDLICVVAYGKIIPKEILDIPKYGCVNVHGSLLPQYRGAAPIQWAVLNGDKVTGVTTMFMNEKMDEGDMILKEKVEIGEYETTGELWDRLSTIGASLLIKTIKQIEAGTAKPEKQGDDFSIAPMLKKEMAKIDWNEMNTEKIKNLVRGLNPIMGAYTFYEGKKIKFWKVRIVENFDFIGNTENCINNSKEKFSSNNICNTKAGEVLLSNPKQGLYIKTIDGVISAKEIQGENSRKMEVCEFLRGNSIETGKCFE